MNAAAQEKGAATYRKPNSTYLLGKRVVDVLVSLTGLAILWPFLLLIGLLIVLDSPGAGPVFAQTRVGKDGIPFTMYKFRTMYPGAEAELPELLPLNEMDGPVFKIRQDPRITRFGRLLRKCCIDELPQLVNVLRGEMSLVGPRPGLPREAEQYDDFARQRLTVTPGITCYWQISPNRNALSFEEWMRLDVRYIRERRFEVDRKILLATAAVVLRRDSV